MGESVTRFFFGMHQSYYSSARGLMLGDFWWWDRVGLPALDRRPFVVGPSAIGARWSRLSVRTTKPARSIAIPEPPLIPRPIVPDELLSSVYFKLGVLLPLPQLCARLGGRRAWSASERRPPSISLPSESFPPRSNSWAPSSKTRS